MRRILISLVLSLSFWTSSATAQVPIEPDEPPKPDLAPIPKPVPLPETDGKTNEGDAESPHNKAKNEFGDTVVPDPPREVTTSPEARAKKLDALFVRLRGAEDPQKAELIAEEVWAHWLQSGSATVDYLILRGSEAQAKGDLELAQKLFDRVTMLAPDYAEGWSRAGRLEMDLENYSTAIDYTQKALVLEPRHFYALWTFGNMLERMENNEGALDVYKEALKHYPELEAVKSRVKMLEVSTLGDVL